MYYLVEAWLDRKTHTHPSPPPYCLHHPRRSSEFEPGHCKQKKKQEINLQYNYLLTGICDNSNISTFFVSGTQNAKAQIKCFKNVTETVTISLWIQRRVLNFKETKMHVEETAYKMNIFMRFKPTLVSNHSVHTHQQAKWTIFLKMC